MPEDKLAKYLALARFNANLFSKDRSRKVGAVLLSPDGHSVLSMGYNGLPRGCDDDVEARHLRPEKYLWFEHAERNAVYNVARPALAGSMAVLTHAPTAACARALASVGVVAVATRAPGTPAARDWQVVQEMLAEAGVELVVMEQGAGSRHASHAVIAEHLALADAHARRSKAPFGQSAALFVSPVYGTRRADGYNGQPRGCDDARHERATEAERGFWYETAVRNAIFNAARVRLQGATAVVTLMPCMECARALAAVGVRTVVAPGSEARAPGVWDEHWVRTRELFDELGVELVLLREADLVPQ